MVLDESRGRPSNTLQGTFVPPNHPVLADVKINRMGRVNWTVPCLLGLVGTACAEVPTSPIAAPTSSPDASAAAPSPFIPARVEVGDDATLALTFPDGRKAVVAYPTHLDVAGMGVQPDVDLTWRGRWVGGIVFSHDGPVDWVLGREVGVHRIADGPVEEWTARPRDGRHQATTGWLVFRLASWTVHVPLDEAMQAEDLLGRVRPYETDDGYIALKVTEPAALAEGFGEAGGAQLAFGDHDPRPDFVRPGQDGLLIEVAPTNCRRFTIQVHGSYGSACLNDGSFFVNGTDFSDRDGSQQKLRGVIEGLRVLEPDPAS